MYSTLSPLGPVLRTSVQYSVALCNRPEGASDVISGNFVRQIVFEKSAKFCDPCLNRSHKIPPEAVGRGIFGSLSLHIPNAYVGMDYGRLCKIE